MSMFGTLHYRKDRYQRLCCLGLEYTLHTETLQSTVPKKANMLTIAVADIRLATRASEKTDHRRAKILVERSKGSYKASKQSFTYSQLRHTHVLSSFRLKILILSLLSISEHADYRPARPCFSAQT